MQREEMAVAPTQPEKKFKRESSALPPATPIVQVQHIAVTPREDPDNVPMPFITPRSLTNLSSASSFSSATSSVSAASSVSVASSASFPPIQSMPSMFTSSNSVQPAPVTSSLLNSTHCATSLDRPVQMIGSPVKSSFKPGHRPFKKEATDKWVSALALLELAHGVS
ncbi:uncharacterized protein LOC127874468 [Dreissena polymorpha]|nr:uncharacterized protein LOC127874468 [Dreissena polymorpha]